MATVIDSPDQMVRIFQRAPAVAVNVYRPVFMETAIIEGRHYLPARFNLRADVRAAEGGVEVRPVPGGPWSWVERGTRPHRIPSAARPAAPMPIAQDAAPFASGAVLHPGTVGKGGWSRTLDIMEVQIDFHAQEVWTLAEAA